jgi:hypothetical protein
MRQFKWIEWNLRRSTPFPDVFGELGDVPIFVITAY